jgi:hypothetical protein
MGRVHAPVSVLGFPGLGSTIAFVKKVSGVLSVSLRLVAIALSIAVLTTACGSDGDSSENAREFCDIAREQYNSADGFDPFGIAPADIEAFFVSQLDLTAEGVEAAPNDAIKADLQTVARSQTEVAKILDAVDWDIFAVEEMAIDEFFERPEVVDAGDRLEAYGLAECGIPADDDDDAMDAMDDGDDFDFANESPELLEAMFSSPALRQMMIDEMVADSGISPDQANCFLDNLVDGGLFSLNGEQEPDAAEMLAMLEVFADCGISPDAFE